LKIQQTGAVNYQSSAAYSLSGAVTTLTYPSGRTVTHTYDQAGRLTALNGNLGDGSIRTYATGILYSPTGGLVKEQFGTTTPIYNKLFYNSRGQLAEIRASTSYTGPTDYDANRGAIINNYSSQCTGICSGSSMPDNNGNLKQQDIQIPSVQTRSQFYEYDSLNRLKSAREVIAAAEQWKQQFTYDRWGNRLIDNAVTYGVGINNKAFTVSTVNNRLGVPAGQSGTMTYDNAGNLTHDTYTGAGNRTYDGENKITSATGANNQAQTYSYDASGQRIKRDVYDVETWQVYGLGGELVAEYAASGAPTSPQKEYGYRNGQLLITANGNAGALTNFALNKTATQSSTHASGAVASRAVDGNTDGVFVNGSVTHTLNDLNAWWQVDLGQVQSINTLKIWNRVESPERLTSFYVFVSDVPFTSTDLTTTQNQAGVSSYYTAGQCGFPTELAINRTGRYVRVQLAGTNYLSIAEVQILGITPPTNVALNKTATQSSTHSSGAVASRAVDGNTDGVFANGSVTHTNSDLDAWWQVDLGQVETIGTIKIWNRVEAPERLSNFYVFVSEQPFTSTDLTTTQNQAGVSSYYTSGQCGFPTELGIYRTGRYVRVQLAGTNYLSIAEVQVFTGPSAPPVQWLISDHLGTPRMVLDQTGSLASIKRHDYLPFGEELVPPTGGRSAAQGYSGGDGIRQQFTQKERDVETGLDYFGARYYANIQGRFTSVDPANYQAMLNPGDPQSWNGYSYVNNNPLTRTDPDGRGFWEKFKNWVNGYGFQSNDDVQKEENQRRAELAQLAATTPTNLLYVQQPDDSYLAYDVNQLTRKQVWDFSNRQRARNVTQMSQQNYDEAVRVVATAATFLGGTGGITVYRGGSKIEVRDIDVKIKDGLVQSTRGPSLNLDPAKVEKFGGAYRVESIPDELQIIQRGVNASHYEIVPKNPMPLERFIELVKQVKLVPQ
jgi:RHS repeat-associated protein